MIDNKSSKTTIVPGGQSIIRMVSELVRYRDLVSIFVYRDLVSKYKQTLLGPVWIVLEPALMTAIYTIVFGEIMKVPTNGVPHILFYLCGVTFWSLFANNLLATSALFYSNEHIFSKVYFPRLLVVVSHTISNLIIFAIQLTIFVTTWWFIKATDSTFLLNFGVIATLFLATSLLCILSIGLGLILAASTIKYRDLRHLTPPIIQILLYSSAVLYPISIASSVNQYLTWNPLVHVFELIRASVFGISTEIMNLLFLSSVSILILFFGIFLFRKTERNFIDSI